MKIATEQDRKRAHELIDGWKLVEPMELIGRKWKVTRKAAQNALSHVWYSQRDKQSGRGIMYERCFCKLTYGVPILLRESDFAEFWELGLKNLNYECQMKAMEFTQITSIMTVIQMTEFLNTMETESSINGFELTKPEDYKLAMGIK